MKRKKPTFKIYSYGEYSEWNRESKTIPKILDFKTDIKAKAGTEFGFVLHIRQGKGKTLTFKIDHPPFTDDTGEIVPPYTGEQFITSNDFMFYIGDSVNEPVVKQLGEWKITVYYRGEKIAGKKFKLC